MKWLGLLLLACGFLLSVHAQFSLDISPLSQPGVVGTSVPFTVTVTNIGNNALENVILNSIQSFTCTRVIGSMLTGQSVTFQCFVFVSKLVNNPFVVVGTGNVVGNINSRFTAVSPSAIVVINTPLPPVTTPSGNAQCNAAQMVSVPGTATGTTVGSPNIGLPFCFDNTGGLGAGLFFRIVGTGKQVVADTCGSDFDTQITVFCGDCDIPVCIAGNDDAFDPPCNLQSRVTFCTVAGQEYLIRVFSQQTGNVVLHVANVNNVPCQPDCSNEPFPVVVAPQPLSIRCELALSGQMPLNITGIPQVLASCGFSNLQFRDVNLPGCCPNSFTINREFVATSLCPNKWSRPAAQSIVVIDHIAPTISAALIPIIIINNQGQKHDRHGNQFNGNLNTLLVPGISGQLGGLGLSVGSFNSLATLGGFPGDLTAFGSGANLLNIGKNRQLFRVFCIASDNCDNTTNVIITPIVRILVLDVVSNSPFQCGLRIREIPVICGEIIEIISVHDGPGGPGTPFSNDFSGNRKDIRNNDCNSNNHGRTQEGMSIVNGIKTFKVRGLVLAVGASDTCFNQAFSTVGFSGTGAFPNLDFTSALATVEIVSGPLFVNHGHGNNGIGHH